jgi:hypothetical protein
MVHRAEVCHQAQVARNLVGADFVGDLARHAGDVGRGVEHRAVAEVDAIRRVYQREVEVVLHAAVEVGEEAFQRFEHHQQGGTCVESVSVAAQFADSPADLGTRFEHGDLIT